MDMYHEDESQIIIFGCGNAGLRAFDFFGAGRVAFFCSNTPKRWGTRLRGKQILAPTSLGQFRESCLIIISVESDHSRVEIALQLLNMRMHNFYLFEDYRLMCTAGQADSITDFSLTQALISEVTRLKQQLDFFRSHVRPADLLPAGGYLRTCQTGLMELLLRFGDIFAELNIHPILYAGTFLGYVRHNGFIPWDDDLDLLLIRPEYERLLQYFRNNYPVELYDGRRDGNSECAWDFRVFQKHRGEPYLAVYPEHLQINFGMDYFDKRFVDFFSLDQYRSDYPFSDHRARLRRLKASLHPCDGGMVRSALVRQFIERDEANWDPNGSNLFYGADNASSYAGYREPEQFISYHDFFPLKEVVFEGARLFVPRNANAFLEYYFGPHWASLPEDAGLSMHKYMSKWARTFLKSADIVCKSKEELQWFAPVYEKLRAHDIYAVMVLASNADDFLAFAGQSGLESVTENNYDADIVVCAEPFPGLSLYGPHVKTATIAEDSTEESIASAIASVIDGPVSRNGTCQAAN